jgi:ATP-dependent Clp protease ATP-binding subunit ClpA
VIHQVVDKFIVELQVQLDAKGVSLEVSEEARHWLAEESMTGQWEQDPWAGSFRSTSRSPWPTRSCSDSLVDGGIEEVSW